MVINTSHLFRCDRWRCQFFKKTGASSDEVDCECLVESWCCSRWCYCCCCWCWGCCCFRGFSSSIVIVVSGADVYIGSSFRFDVVVLLLLILLSFTTDCISWFSFFLGFEVMVVVEVVVSWIGDIVLHLGQNINDDDLFQMNATI